MLCWPRWRRCLPAFRREWKAEILWWGRSRRKHKAKAPFVRGTRSVREGMVKRYPLRNWRGYFTVPLLCHIYAKRPQETAIFAKAKNAENPHEQRKNPHFCGFFLWRRWRDLNPRGTFAPYSLSRGAPSPLGYISKGYELLSEVLAERMGFEPMALMSHRFSRPAP